MARLRLLATALIALSLMAGEASVDAQPPWPSASTVDTLLSRGDAALARGDNISSLGFYRDAIARAPRDVRGYVALGNAYLALSEPKNALEVFEAGARNTRGNLALSLGLARTYEKLGKVERALATLRQEAAQGQVSRELYEALAELAERNAALVEALTARRALLQALLALPEPPEAELRMAKTRVAALALLLAGTDRLSARHCDERGQSIVLRALLTCP